ncbi:MAG: HU family DNA-binding protein [Planctomycetes bacterium]|nr:HU family DNA-binding protein [Planctomycetota bacterium]
MTTSGDNGTFSTDGQPIGSARPTAGQRRRETIAKRTIAERIAERHGLGQVQTLQVIQAFLDEVVDELAKGNRLEFRDFGVFETVTRKARTALNPKTLEKVPVKSRTVVKFKVGRLLKDKVENLSQQDDAGTDVAKP